MPNPSPCVSVVIPCYNYAEYLREAICSVISQTYDNWEIVVVDDGSEDDSADVTKALIHEFRYLRQHIDLIQIPNSGVSAARNAGIAAARGKYFLPLDADDVIADTMLEKTVMLLDRSPDIAIAYTDLYTFEQGKISYQMGFPEYDFDLLCRQMNYFYCALTRRTAWERTGGYDPALAALEDWEFAIHCGKQGFAARRIAEPLFGVRRKPTGLHTRVLEDHLALRAQIAIKHAELFNPVTRAWAEAILGTGPADDAPAEILAAAQVTQQLSRHQIVLDRTLTDLTAELTSLRAQLARCGQEHPPPDSPPGPPGPLPVRDGGVARWLLGLQIAGRRAAR